MKKTARTNIIVTVIIATVLTVLLNYITGCDFPRGNPLDPKAYNYGLMDPENPELPVLQVTSFHSSQWFPLQDLFYLETLVSGASAETADSVYFVYSDTILFTMNLSGGQWHRSLESSSFLSANIYDLIGVPHYALLYFGTDEPIKTEESRLYRIIDEVPETVFPDNNVSVIPDFEFDWESSTVKFEFTYTISINFISTTGFVTEVDRIENISSDLTTYLYSEGLESGSYYWTLSIVDDFSNISRSKEAAFSVAP